MFPVLSEDAFEKGIFASATKKVCTFPVLSEDAFEKDIFPSATKQFGTFLVLTEDAFEKDISHLGDHEAVLLKAWVLVTVDLLGARVVGWRTF